MANPPRKCEPVGKISSQVYQGASGKRQVCLWASLVSLERHKDTKDTKTCHLWKVRYMSPRDGGHLWETVNVSQRYGAVFPEMVFGVFGISSGSLSIPYAPQIPFKLSQYHLNSCCISYYKYRNTKCIINHPKIIFMHYCCLCSLMAITDRTL
ncbi:hypothetical protein BYT27DRAFT_7111367 [Phlegmacium glaucopus]|nr:hypothetical protein BYT27DRAFT_7111367 [Phlegmacium glaucopus]